LVKVSAKLEASIANFEEEDEFEPETNEPFENVTDIPESDHDNTDDDFVDID